ncbi:O-antigen ligase family protein [Chryseobacterium sp. SNU WT5]|uniref:O-antigen ligase family protein n=1 Tax=Chryseobacterium sp. SNU WT5 TaxID=2594269 RepID=UPI0011800347|nr:O-antigen ligase family protein [Chryseobacterium sp. SNU WT5]QDP85839.1 O-antigen ligase family protein [Chryseobacterium sp. SNU WT5]
MNITKINVYLSTLSFVLCIIGYSLATTFFLPSSSDLESVSQSVTIPYRAFALCVMLLVVSLNIKRSVFPISLPLLVLILYWFFLIIRIFSDIYMRTDYFLTDTSQLWLYIFGICLAGLYSTIKSFDHINTEKAFYFVWAGVILMLTLTLFSNQALLTNTNNEYRVDANVALNTISYGNYGVLGLLLSIYILINKKVNKFWKIFAILSIILCVYSVLRSGSRGPILAFLLVVLFWFFSKGKNLKTGLVILALSFSVLYLLQDFILSLMGEISPVIEVRLRESLEGGVDDGRSRLYDDAINIFLNHPLFGHQFAIFDGQGGYAYAHNLILDSAMALGVLGALAMIYIIFSALKVCYKNIHYNKKYYWVSLILLQQITILMVSGTFYQDQLLSVLLVFHFMADKKTKI